MKVLSPEQSLYLNYDNLLRCTELYLIGSLISGYQDDHAELEFMSQTSPNYIQIVISYSRL